MTHKIYARLIKDMVRELEQEPTKKIREFLYSKINEYADIIMKDAEQDTQILSTKLPEE